MNLFPFLFCFQPVFGCQGRSTALLWAGPSGRATRCFHAPSRGVGAAPQQTQRGLGVQGWAGHSCNHTFQRAPTGIADLSSFFRFYMLCKNYYQDCRRQLAVSKYKWQHKLCKKLNTALTLVISRPLYLIFDMPVALCCWHSYIKSTLWCLIQTGHFKDMRKQFKQQEKAS